jgi:2-C-methyl-D-erythritol 4-phosphate cytidylyltransferase
MKKYIIIVAGGSGKRMQSDLPKQFLSIHGKPVLMHTIEKFFNYDASIHFVLALPQNQIETWKQLCTSHQFNITHTIVQGGNERFHSVLNALAEIKEKCLVAVHDGVRPLVNLETITNCFVMAEKKGNAIPVIPISESLRVVDENANKPVDRNKYKLVQTPQVFLSDLLLKAYQQKYTPEFTDDASVVEKMGITINLVEGNKENIKITTPVDLQIAEALISIKSEL